MTAHRSAPARRSQPAACVPVQVAARMLRAPPDRESWVLASPGCGKVALTHAVVGGDVRHGDRRAIRLGSGVRWARNAGALSSVKKG